MTKKEFIFYLVSHQFASQYEAEQYTYPSGSNDWVYNNPIYKRKAEINNEGILVSQYEIATDTWYTHQIFTNKSVVA